MGITRTVLLIITLAAVPLCVGGDDTARRQSKVLLLDDSVLEGDVSEYLGQIIIRSGRSEIRLPRSQVRCWADSVEGLYQYLVDQRKRDSFESHLALAQWCLRNKHPAGATREFVAAQRIRADDPAVRIIEEQLRQYVLDASQPTRQAVDRSSTDLVPNEQDRLSDDGESPQTDVGQDRPLLSLPPRAVSTYTTIVQPLLLNRCATSGCHGPAGTGEFRLESDARSRRLTALQSRENAEEVLRWVSRDDIENSPLLVFATKPHGGLDAPPLGPRDQAAIESLRKWLRELSANDSPRRAGLAPNSASPQESPESRSAPSASNRSQGISSVPARLPQVSDPFDPDLFNRLYRTQGLLSGVNEREQP